MSMILSQFHSYTRTIPRHFTKHPLISCAQVIQENGLTVRLGPNGPATLWAEKMALFGLLFSPFEPTIFDNIFYDLSILIPFFTHFFNPLHKIIEVCYAHMLLNFHISYILVTTLYLSTIKQNLLI